MNDVQLNGIQYFVLIADQKKKSKFLALLGEHGARSIDTVYAHGSMSPSAIAAAFGFEAEQNKVMISCLLKTENAKRLMEILYTDYKFNKPNTGIAFSIAVEGLAF
ncbi:MAG: hypothetical protein IJY28_06615 [Clostridia bacterium]|nr:hypothetical protein [Clostridia bacterium]